MTGHEPHKPAILLVDDEPEILFSLKALLRQEFVLHTAESGREALEILRQFPIQVIMTDQRMPEMTGVELMGRAKTQYPDAIRIIFTGYADIKAVVDAINHGGLFRYITKPWDPDELISLLQDAVSEYDALVRGRDLLANVHQHLTDGQRIANTLLRQPTDLDPSELSLFVDRGAQLLLAVEREQNRKKE
jgi:DNA-binding NtrC family response regulator